MQTSYLDGPEFSHESGWDWDVGDGAAAHSENLHIKYHAQKVGGGGITARRFSITERVLRNGRSGQICTKWQGFRLG